MSNQKAQELLESADKKATQKGWFSGPKFDEAGELYEQASNQFKLSRQMGKAGEAMVKAAQMSLNLNDTHDAAQRFITASKAFKKTHPEQAVDALAQAVSILREDGKFRIAAAHEKEIGKLSEELSDLERAMRAYEQAAQWYADDDSTALASGCLVKAASLAAQLENYTHAVELFEGIAEGAVDDSLTKWSVKDYFFKAALCRLAIPDAIGAAEGLKRYQELDPSFSKTRECGFLDEIIGDIQNSDLQSFTDHVANYDSVSQLDNWKTTLLLRIKRQVVEAEEDLT
ncbi:vesicular-fusion protein S17 [Coemansia sp. RSA 2523]|nr:vesicular-fusion protein S17 [Coemansia sp. RSA 1591]KAJ1766806.1 vesicular-fusion protein S17 [Coemansia sp. RSA 1752]KAJ1779527.1 vesicular-fusion protein S17 [Coemansia sp. RSA 1824]KAJ1791997.1 vesicular-fusion protein S17 [Coemansia sp. RSA 2167]KAJ1794510.1 vesicular-fusion protein S17 [Coemansia sp. RSA 1938]KAJ1809964.1 vesicular-fusion protein S17 [Coemansia sp. RSA 2523]KAJ2133145.1 vesicular-fusion protein S17 [Coemansia sp. RSA 921]KAJ2138674.1 vesicular-fusion protein S17 [Co